MTSSFLHLYGKMQEWWGIVKRTIYAYLISLVISVNFYQERLFNIQIQEIWYLLFQQIEVSS